MAKRPLDLIGPLAKLDWADGQIPAIQRAQSELLASHTRRMFGLRRTTGERDRFFLRTYIDPFTVSPALAVHIGTIIHAQRSALDLLICELSERNGAPPNRKPHFPVREDEAEFLTDKRVRLDMRDLTDREKAILVGLKPWKGGHDHIYLLHQLNLLDKHRKLIVASRHIESVSLVGTGWLKNLQIERVAEGDKVTLLREGSLDFVTGVVLAITMNDGSVVPILSALHDFGTALRDILKLFHAEAAREAEEGA